MPNEEDINQLSILGVSVITLAIVVVLGIIILGAFGYTTRQVTTTAAVPGLFVVPAVNASVAIGATGTYPYLQSLGVCYNATALNATNTSFTSEFYTINEGNANGGSITLKDVSTLPSMRFNSSFFVGQSMNCTVTYKAATTGSNAADTFNTGILTFGTFLALIILSFIGKIIIGMFRRGL